MPITFLQNPPLILCISLTIQLNPTGDRIEDIKFEGTGCAIAIAGVIRALICLGIKEYVETNQQLITDTQVMVTNGNRIGNMSSLT
ncbi:MAG: iron-sulfur cluster assembly scaffold protein [Coleofasciculus sp. B1-GNL1-01]|uniref:iron-sulfur cluster assembly scaffold protein n=1 Tax=Coleofasciculus sp. B1-GNL1-01 TaxID=3068484 RepID=UPI0032F6DB08